MVANLVLESSTLSGNHGGGLFNGAFTLLLNATVSGNVDGSGILNSNVLVPAGDQEPMVSVIFSTVADNAPYGIDAESGGEPSVLLLGSIVAGNATADCSHAAETESQGSNIASDDTCGLGVDDAPETDPMLSPLGDHGGPTATHVPLDGSPAIDFYETLVDQASHAPGRVAEAETVVDCGLLADQRHLVRPVDGDGDQVAICDVGAVEVQPQSVVEVPALGPAGAAGLALLLAAAASFTLRRRTRPNA